MSRAEEKHQTFLEIAEKLGRLGTCNRARVGALIVKDGRCISWGYNGAPPGLSHCDQNDHGWNGNTDLLILHGCRNVTHAEANAVAFAARQGISTDGGTLYVSHEPCRDCAKILIAAGISHVIASEPYPRDSGTMLLDAAGVGVEIGVSIS